MFLEENFGSDTIVQLCQNDFDNIDSFEILDALDPSLALCVQHFFSFEITID
jgi:hypothetical protein